MAFAVENFRKVITAALGTDAAALTTGIDLGGYRVAAIVNPSTWTTASLTFLSATSSDATYYTVHGTTGNEVTVTTTGQQVICLDSDASLQISANRWLKLQSGVYGTVVAQSSAVTFSLVLA